VRVLIGLRSSHAMLDRLCARNEIDLSEYRRRLEQISEALARP